jgi:hypothetical protein
MRPLLCLLALLALSQGLAACGGSGGRAVASASTAVTVSGPAPLETKTDADKDNDIGAPSDDANNSQALDFGHAASSSEQRAITALVKRYYAAALAENGARGCALLYSTIAEAAPEDDSREPGTPAYMQHLTTCAQVLTALFKHYHPQLAAELPKLQVTRVRLEEHHGWAFLSFGTLPERRISVQRERHVWKMSQILDEELP